MDKLTDFIVEYNNVLDKSLCKRIINSFEEDDRKYQGITTGDLMGIDGYAWKKSTDLNISQLSEWGEIDHQLFHVLSDHLKMYVDHLRDHGCDYGIMENAVDTGYQIQRTNAGEYYKWHSDFGLASTADPHIIKARDFSYIFYLNEGFEGGGTQFFNDNGHIVTPKTGKLLIFPANTIWVHQGMEVTEGSKYIIAGWLMSDKHLPHG